ncbi:hypothetical protein HDU97_007740 [Phlyctochytrium planicorne]|nr:hypothetical protein HDU97_007740 [Phlyctochytrium planicorne]
MYERIAGIDDVVALAKTVEQGRNIRNPSMNMKRITDQRKLEETERNQHDALRCHINFLAEIDKIAKGEVIELKSSLMESERVQLQILLKEIQTLKEMAESENVMNGDESLSIEELHIFNEAKALEEEAKNLAENQTDAMEIDSPVPLEDILDCKIIFEEQKQQAANLDNRVLSIFDGLISAKLDPNNEKTKNSIDNTISNPIMDDEILEQYWKFLLPHTNTPEREMGEVRTLDVIVDHSKLLPSKTNVLIRTYGLGSDILIDRKQELMNMLILSEKGLSPELFCRFGNGLVYGYTNGKPLSLDDMQNPKIAVLVAKHLAQWHQVVLPGIEPKAGLFSTMRRWLDNVIDYEYGQYNPRGFDIGNHFCEYAGFDCQWDLYPSEAYQKRWLVWYLQTSTNQEPSTEEVNQLYAEVNKYALAAHMFWGIWALVQSKISDLDFDYAGYAQLRFGEYSRRRDAFLAL